MSKEKEPIKIPSLALTIVYSFAIGIYTYCVHKLLTQGVLEIEELIMLLVNFSTSYIMYSLNKKYHDYKKEKLHKIIEEYERRKNK